jgi:tRNA dimethylallyltransferase
MNRPPYNLITVLGPTASGKTRFAALLASRLDGEIISADSRQVYRGMDIGTGKDYNDYIVEGKSVPVHLLDIAEPGYEYNVFEYQADFIRVFNEIGTRRKIPVICGGSGLYLEAVLKGYRLINVPIDHNLRKTFENMSDDELSALLKSWKPVHNKTDLVSRKRLIRALEIESYYRVNPVAVKNYPELNPLITGILCDRDTRRERITARLKERLENGMIEEVERLVSSGISYEKLIYYGLEYKYIALFLKGELSYDEMVMHLNIAIHQFAKRQMTWFRRMERGGLKIHWIDADLPDEQKVKLTLEWFRMTTGCDSSYKQAQE